MDDIIKEFLAETNESLNELDNDLVQLEQDPSNMSLISKIFRVLHTIKGTCGFLGLTRLEKVAHKGEDLLGLFRDKKLEVTGAYVTLILESFDCIKTIVTGLEATGQEPDGDDSDVIQRLEEVYNGAGKPPEAISNETSLDFMSVFEPEPIVQVQEDVQEVSLPESNVEIQEISEPQAVHVSSEPKPSVVANPTGEHEHASAPDTANQTLRVNVDVLENLMTMVSELVLTRNQLLQTSRQNKESEFLVPLQRLNHVVSDLQEGVMKTRMQPIGNAWQKLPRIIRDVSKELGKKIDLEMYGQDTELDRQILDMIKDPLTHMVRNSADHGVEMPADRLANGKPETGKVVLKAFHQGGHIIIEISDDGKGLSMDKIKKKILQNGLATEDQLAQMTPQYVQQFIFQAGFSTAEKVTAVSGRGVGMDVVRSNIEKIGGAIEMRSEEGLGTTFTIKIPLTLAIVSALIVGTSNQRFAIPQLTISELVLVGKSKESCIERVNNARVLRLRDKLLPLVSLAELLGFGSQKETETQYIVVTKSGSISFGLIVDFVYDLEEIVIKPLSRNLKGLPIYSGNTILGDGCVIMILDSAGILKTAGVAEVIDNNDNKKAETGEDALPENLLLLFHAGDETLKAVPVDSISRLEEIDVSEIETADGKKVIPYLGHLMPICSIDESIKTEQRRPLIILQHNNHTAGLLADKILDIAKYRGLFNTTSSHAIADSVMINGHAADIVNAELFAASGVVIKEGAAHA